MIYWEDIISDEELIEMYKTHSLLEMDEILGVSKQSIGRRLVKLGVTIRKPGWFTKTKERRQEHAGQLLPFNRRSVGSNKDDG